MPRSRRSRKNVRRSRRRVRRGGYDINQQSVAPVQQTQQQVQSPLDKQPVAEHLRHAGKQAVSAAKSAVGAAVGAASGILTRLLDTKSDEHTFVPQESSYQLPSTNSQPTPSYTGGRRKKHKSARKRTRKHKSKHSRHNKRSKKSRRHVRKSRRSRK